MNNRRSKVITFPMMHLDSVFHYRELIRKFTDLIIEIKDPVELTSGHLQPLRDRQVDR